MRHLDRRYLWWISNEPEVYGMTAVHIYTKQQQRIFIIFSSCDRNEKTSWPSIAMALTMILALQHNTPN